MKTMTCRQLGGACDQEFNAECFDDMAELVKAHGVEMFHKQDRPHLDAMQRVFALMHDPDFLKEWSDSKQKEFDALPEN
jgi:hypothetical protein